MRARCSRGAPGTRLPVPWNQSSAVSSMEHERRIADLREAIRMKMPRSGPNTPGTSVLNLRCGRSPVSPGATDDNSSHGSWIAPRGIVEGDVDTARPPRDTPLPVPRPSSPTLVAVFHDEDGPKPLRSVTSRSITSRGCILGRGSRPMDALQHRKQASLAEARASAPGRAQLPISISTSSFFGGGGASGFLSSGASSVLGWAE